MGPGDSGGQSVWGRDENRPGKKPFPYHGHQERLSWNRPRRALNLKPNKETIKKGHETDPDSQGGNLMESQPAPNSCTSL